MDALTKQALLDGIIVGSIPGIFFGIIVVAIMGLLMTKKNWFIKAITFIIVNIIFIGICFGGLRSERINFNNGYCIRCGAKYQAIQHQRNQTYYECPECYFGTWN